MFYYEWKGLNSYGEKCQGKLSAKNKKDLHYQLKLQHITLLSGKSSLWQSLLQYRITEKQIQSFFNQLATLLTENITLNDSLNIIQQTVINPHFKKIMSHIIHRVQSGSSFANALEHYPHHFSPLMIELIRTGEQTGKLANALQTLSHDMLQRKHIKQQCIKALIYPISLLSLSLMITFIIIQCIVPQFLTLYQRSGVALPFITQCLINIANITGPDFLITISLIIPALVKIARHFKFMDKFSRKITLLYWIKTLNLGLSSHLSLPNSLEMANQILRSPKLKQDLKRAAQQVKEGRNLYLALRNTGYFSSSFLSLVHIGEQTHRLAELVAVGSEQQQTEFLNRLIQLTKLIEPLTLLVVAVFIGGIIIALYLPIFNLGNLF